MLHQWSVRWLGRPGASKPVDFFGPPHFGHTMAHLFDLHGGFNVRGKADLILVINAYNYFLSCTIRDMHMPQAYVLKNNKLDIYII